MNTRRTFLKKVALGGAVLSVSGIVSAAAGVSAKASKITVNKGDIILFQGDSITDAGRDKDSKNPNTPSMMGNGYVMLTAGSLLHKLADRQPVIYNKGISGNKVYQLVERWDADCLDIKPNVLSILIGVNDYWHTKNGYDGTLQKYESDYHTLIERTLTALPKVKLVICEPFALMVNNAVDSSWFPDFDGYREVAKNLATEFDAIFVPFQKVFDEAQKLAPGSYWTGDGVHPTLAGAQLMADAWMKIIKS
ncbi:MAG: SGNH/GDSL hydrolase family protein [Prevotellaceae bacterium]|jgi:lysophospholipase L1-like esterase|nr:SGNH/GDSL hydrolase family protein [Prevotellaceae bacterium]